MSIDRLAAKAEERLREEAGRNGASEEERGVWMTVEINPAHIRVLENCPARPLNDPERRARLLGVVLALGIDRAKVNRLAGGI